MKLTIREWKLIIEALDKWERDTAYAVNSEALIDQYIAETHERVHDLRVKIDTHGF